MILQNAAYCLKCDTYIISTHVHDYRSCNCGNIAVDGGNEYLKRSVAEKEDFIDYSLSTESIPEEIRAKLLWGSRGKDGTEPLKFLPIGQRDTEHLEAILKTQTQINDLYKTAIRTELRIRKIENI